MDNIVLLTTKEVVRRAKHVKIDYKRIKEVVKMWAKEDLASYAWPKEFHFNAEDEQKMLDYLVVLDTLNFCFWSKNKKWRVSYKGKEYSGYFALSLALKRFFEKNPDKASLDYFNGISFGEFAKILSGEGELLFLMKRWEMIKAVSAHIAKNYEGDSRKFILSAESEASTLAIKIFNELPFFNDVSYYNGYSVYFLKRAQILVCDVMHAFGGRGIGYFKDPEWLTAFADYKVPQILYRLGVLNYSRDLRGKIINRILIPSGSPEEIEIRAATIWAVERIKKTLAIETGKTLYSFQVDNFLWEMSQADKFGFPHHLTETIYY